MFCVAAVAVERTEMFYAVHPPAFREVVLLFPMRRQGHKCN